MTIWINATFSNGHPTTATIGALVGGHLNLGPLKHEAVANHISACAPCLVTYRKLVSFDPVTYRAQGSPLALPERLWPSKTVYTVVTPESLRQARRDEQAWQVSCSADEDTEHAEWCLAEFRRLVPVPSVYERLADLAP